MGMGVTAAKLMPHATQQARKWGDEMQGQGKRLRSASQETKKMVTNVLRTILTLG